MPWFKFSYLFILFISLVVLTRCESYINAIEGESTQLHFPYPCDSTKITLQYENRRPFYSSANPQYLKLNGDQSKRFTLENAINMTNGSECFLQVHISPVKRTDAVTYILLAYVNDYIKKVGLHVDFLPGKAYCTSIGKHIIDEWVKLHCAAPVGSESFPGQIQCYQDGRVMPPLGEPSETLQILEQITLVQENHGPVFCCSSPWIEPKNRCDCNDFVFDPLSGGEVYDAGGPCPATAPATIPAQVENETLWKSEKSQANSPTTDRVTTTQLPDQQNSSNFDSGISITILVVCFLILLFLFVALSIYYLTKAKILQRHGRMDTSMHKGFIPQGDILAYLKEDKEESHPPDNSSSTV